MRSAGFRIRRTARRIVAGRVRPLLRAATFLALTGAASAEAPVLLVGEPAATVRLPTPAGQGRLVLPVGPSGPVPVVILFPDTLGEDGRAEAYAETLASRGIAAVVLGLGDDADGTDPAAEPASTAAAVPVAVAWAERDGRFSPGRIGVLGFGAGGRAVLAVGVRPAVALYPGCRGLTVEAGGPVLILHGTEAPDAEARIARPDEAGVIVASLLGAGHAWGAPGPLPPERVVLLPDPAGGPRLTAAPDGAVTRLAASIVAEFLDHAGRPLLEAAR